MLNVLTVITAVITPPVLTEQFFLPLSFNPHNNLTR